MFLLGPVEIHATDRQQKKGTPTLYAVNGEERTPIEPRYFKAYYIGIDGAEIPYPEDFATVAGNASATSQADVDELTGVQWFCEYGQTAETDAKDAAAFPLSGCNLGRLQSLLLFHDCVNPDTLESAYSGRHNLPRENRCPEGMLRVPQLRFSVRFDHSEALPDGWSGEAPLELASGPSYSWHGDFINGWLPEAAENMLLASSKRDFQAVEGPLTEVPDCAAEDADPERGTGDYDESLLAMGSVADRAVDEEEPAASSTADASPSSAEEDAATPTEDAESTPTEEAGTTPTEDAESTPTDDAEPTPKPSGDAVSTPASSAVPSSASASAGTPAPAPTSAEDTEATPTPSSDAVSTPASSVVSAPASASTSAGDLEPAPTSTGSGVHTADAPRPSECSGRKGRKNKKRRAARRASKRSL